MAPSQSIRRICDLSQLSQLLVRIKFISLVSPQQRHPFADLLRSVVLPVAAVADVDEEHAREEEDVQVPQLIRLLPLQSAPRLWLSSPHICNTQFGFITSLARKQTERGESKGERRKDGRGKHKK